MKKRTYVWILVLIFLVLAFAAGLSFFFLSFDRTPSIPSSACLRLDLSGEIVEYAVVNFWANLPPRITPLSVYDIWSDLRKAKVDPRIQGAFVKIGLLDCSWAKCEEIRGALLDFRKSGKKAVAFLEELPDADKEYFLATGCDRIALHPLGWLGINGLGGPTPFFKKALDKLGIKPEVEHVEEYKTAYNQFTETGFTAAHREMNESLLRDRFEEYIATVAEARKKTREEVRALIDQAFFQGQEAKDAGLVDDVAYEDQALALCSRDGRPLQPLPLPVYTRIDPATLGLNTGRRIALIYGQGMIHSGSSLGQTMGSDTVGSWFRAAREDASIKAVVFRVDSPGGSAVASDAIWREVELTRRKKPVVVSMSDVAGSGGYWVSMGADRIIAQPQTLTGSIGVLSGKIDVSGLAAKIGVTTDEISFGRNAGIFSPFRTMSEEDRALFKKQIRWIYGRFTAQAAEGRNMTPEAVDKIGRGRVWTGRQAKGLGLVDDLGGLDEAIAAAKDLSGIGAGEEVRLIIWPKRLSFFESIFGRRDSDAADALGGLLPRDMRSALEWAIRLNEDRVWAVMPIFSF